MSEWKGPRYRLPRLGVLLATGTPTMAEICTALNAGRRSIEEDLRALEDGGIGIERLQSSGGDRPGRHPTRYRLTGEARRQLGGAG